MENKRVSVSEASAKLGVSPQFIRIAMQRKELPIGTAIKMSTKWTYHISPGLLQVYVEGKGGGHE